MPEKFSIVREPDDPLADVRISLGHKKGLGGYLVFRGTPQDTIELLEGALKVAQEALPKFLYSDHRGRSQG